MNTKSLEYFIEAADEKSFSRAARKSYISTNALIKHINALEAETGTSLFQRTNNGIILTHAGSVFYDDARKVLAEIEDALNRVAAVNGEESVLRIGSSLLRPHYRIFNYCLNYIRTNRAVKYQVVPFTDPETDLVGSHEFYSFLGKDYDIVACTCPPGRWGDQCQLLELEQVPLRLSVPINHPLAVKKKILIEDLKDQTLVIPQRGINSVMDRLADELIQRMPGIRFHLRMKHFDAFNEAADQNYLIVSSEALRDIHPSLLTKEVDWDYTMPYGIIYANAPTPEVLDFIEYTKDHLHDLPF